MVLVAAGGDINFDPYTSAEIYDPATWTETGSLAIAREGHTASCAEVPKEKCGSGTV